MLWFYQRLLRLRPAPLGSALKKILGIRRQTVEAKSGFCFFVDPVSQFGFEILSHGEYEPPLTQLLSAVLRPGDVFLDIGANEGYFSVHASRLVGESGSVHCVEPQSRLQSVLRKNFEMNACNNVRIHAVALSGGETPMRLHLASDSNSGATSFYRHWRFGRASEVVASTTLDRLTEDLSTIRLVKTDCEGAETLVFQGAGGALARRQFQFINVEYHPAITGLDAAVHIDRAIRSSGYVLSQVGNGMWVYHLPELEAELHSLGTTRSIDAIA